MPVPKLVNATVKRRTNDVAVTWEINGDLEDPTLSPWVLAVFLIGGENGPIHQYAFRHADGRVTDVYRFDHVGIRNEYLQVTPDRLGSTWRAVFPTDDAVAQSGKWEAVLGFDELENDHESQVTGTF